MPWRKMPLRLKVAAMNDSSIAAQLRKIAAEMETTMARYDEVAMSSRFRVMLILEASARALEATNPGTGAQVQPTEEAQTGS